MDNDTIRTIERELDNIKAINLQLDQLMMAVHADRIAALEDKKKIAIQVVKQIVNRPETSSG